MGNPVQTETERQSQSERDKAAHAERVSDLTGIKAGVKREADHKVGAKAARDGYMAICERHQSDRGTRLANGDSLGALCTRILRGGGRKAVLAEIAEAELDV